MPGRSTVARPIYQIRPFQSASRRDAGTIRYAWSCGVDDTMFQSASRRDAGTILTCCRRHKTVCVFQSASRRDAGTIAGAPTPSWLERFQSASRRDAGTIHVPQLVICPLSGFNPRPGVMPGRSRGAVVCRAGPAFQSASRRDAGTIIFSSRLSALNSGFQSASRRDAGTIYGLDSHGVDAAAFQSASRRDAGTIPRWCQLSTTSSGCFNPRPGVMPGRSCALAQRRWTSNVSIRVPA